MYHKKKPEGEEIKDNLGIRELFKNIKIKKFEFLFIIILVVITLLIVSIYDMLSNYKNPIIENHIQLLVDNKEQFLQIEKSDNYYIDEMTMNYKNLTDNETNQIEQKLKNINKIGKSVYRIARLHIDSGDVMTYSSLYDLLNINPNRQDTSNPYKYWYDEFDIVEWDDYQNFHLAEIIGRTPKNYDEILISNHLADLLVSFGVKPYGEESYYKPTNYDNLVSSNKYYSFGIDKVKIVGVINFDLSKYESIKNITWDEYNSDIEKYSNTYDDLIYKDKNIYNKIFVTNGFINQLKINNEKKPDDIWENKIIKKGILVTESTEAGFSNILNEFRYDSSITAKSTYSDLVDDAMTLTNKLPDISLISNLLFYIVVVLVIASVLGISKFVLPKHYLKEQNNQRTKEKYIKQMVFGNIILMSAISAILSSISLIVIIKLIKISIVGDNAILNPLFILGTRQFAIIFLSMIGIAIISYLIAIIRIKIVYRKA